MLIGALLTRITQEIVNPLIVLVFLLAVVVFGWGMVLYLSAQGSDDKTQKGKKIMWWGIIGMFLLASMWGVVFLSCDFFGTCQKVGFPGFSSGSGGGIDCSKDITEMTNEECSYCYPGGVSCGSSGGGGDGFGGGGGGITTLTPAEQSVCDSGSRCEPCLHFLDEGNPRAYVKCVKNILGF